MMWINSVLQGKNEEKEMTLGTGQQRRPRKSPVRRTLNVELNERTDRQLVIREDEQLNVWINQYMLLKEISVGINSRVGVREGTEIQIYTCLSKTDQQYYALKSINKHMKSIKNSSRLYRFWGNNAIDVRHFYSS